MIPQGHECSLVSTMFGDERYIQHVRDILHKDRRRLVCVCQCRIGDTSSTLPSGKRNMQSLSECRPHKIKMPHMGHIAKRCVWLIGIGVNIIAVSTDISAIANATAELRRSKTKEVKNMEQVK